MQAHEYATFGIFYHLTRGVHRALTVLITLHCLMLHCFSATALLIKNKIKLRLRKIFIEKMPHFYLWSAPNVSSKRHCTNFSCNSTVRVPTNSSCQSRRLCIPCHRNTSCSSWFFCSWFTVFVSSFNVCLPLVLTNVTHKTISKWVLVIQS